MTLTIIPESAPFNAEQRAWLNGFFSGLLQMQAGDDPASSGMNGGAVGLLERSESTAEDEDDFPWHDPALPIADRLELAKDKPLARQLMAAMAQLDCGSCGYLCQTYSEAIANGTEKNLTLCSPGGSETAKAVKQIYKLQIKDAGSAGTQLKPKPPAEVGTRDNPIAAKFLSASKLNRPGSAKDTRHVEIDLAGTGLVYKVGDALGVYPFNCDELARDIAQAADLDPTTIVTCDGEQMPLLQALTHHRCLRTLGSELVETVLNQSFESERREQLTQLLDSEDIDQWDVLEFFEAFPGPSIDAATLVEALMPLRPRLYSIASSQRKFRSSVHLTIGRVETQLRGRGRKGVASTMFADRITTTQSVRVFVHPSHGFTVPADLAAPMIMVGPGTGIAPFMAFLQEREATNAIGKNWLFFGDQRREVDFLYQDQLTHWLESGLLARLELAWSRDGEKKVYVQDRMRESGAELFAWLQSGGYFFVCGDASRMAIDVDKALHEIVGMHGKMSEEVARAYVADLVKSKRYVRDVY